MPSPGSQASKDQPQGSSGQAGDTADRQKAGEALKKAGEQVANAGEQVGSLAKTDSPTPGQSGKEPDSLVPPSDTPAAGSPSAADSARQASSPSDTASGENSGDQGQPGGTVASAGEASSTGSPAGDANQAPASQAGDAATDQSANAPGTTSQGDQSAAKAGNDTLDAQIQAAQAALEKAGIKLKQAGDAIANANTDAEVARAQDLLSQARILVIVTSQDLQDAKQKMGNANAKQAQVMDNAQKSLDNATLAIVVATNSLLGLPDIDNLPTAAGVPEATSDNDKVGKLDDKLNHTLVVFDGKMDKARNAVLNSTPPPVVSTASTQGNTPEVVADLPAATSAGGAKEKSKVESTESSGANSLGRSKMEKKKNEQVAMQIPEGVGDGQGDDIVAKQLREAAMAETDPKLRQKLWDEYKRYKAGL